MVESVDKNSVELSWQPPKSDGGSPVIGYLVEKRQGYSSKWSPVNKNPVPSPHYICKDLLQDEDYEFRVVAVNDAGNGPPSKTTGNVKTKDLYTKPGKPEDFQVKTKEGKVTLSWQKPRETGNTPISNYRIEMKSSRDYSWKPITPSIPFLSTEMDVDGLEPNLNYDFRVAAENKIGLSDFATAKPFKYGSNCVLIII